MRRKYLYNILYKELQYFLSSKQDIQLEDITGKFLSPLIKYFNTSLL